MCYVFFFFSKWRNSWHRLRPVSRTNLEVFCPSTLSNRYSVFWWAPMWYTIAQFSQKALEGLSNWLDFNVFSKFGSRKEVECWCHRRGCGWRSFRCISHCGHRLRHLVEAEERPSQAGGRPLRLGARNRYWKLFKMLDISFLSLTGGEDSHLLRNLVVNWLPLSYPWTQRIVGGAYKCFLNYQFRFSQPCTWS